MRLIILSLLFATNISYGQKYYWGIGLSFPITSGFTTDFKYLSDSPYSSLPYEIVDQTVFKGASYNINIMFPYNLELRAGMQLKSFFFELNGMPISTQELGLKAIWPIEGEYSNGTEERKFNMGYSYWSLNFIVKHNLLRRSTTKVLPFVGAGVIFPYHYYLLDQPSDGFFKFENDVVPYARVGIELYPTQIFGIDLRYTYHLSEYMGGVKNVNYLEICFKSNFFFRTRYKKDQIYIGE